MSLSKETILTLPLTPPDSLILTITLSEPEGCLNNAIIEDLYKINRAD